MKNIPFYPVLVSIFLLYPATAFADADFFNNDVSDSSYDFTIDTSAGLLYGSAEEYVYVLPNSPSLLSQLSWPVKPLSYLGASFNLEAHKNSGFFLSLSLKNAFPSPTGSMTDTDWISNEGYKTHFSEHDCITEQALLVDFKAGYSLQLIDTLSICPHFSLSYKRFLFSAMDGYIQYGPNTDNIYTNIEWSDDFEKTYMYGRGISYEQNWFLLAFGIRMNYEISSRLTGVTELRFSPVVLCSAVDNHYFRGLEFTDIMDGVFGFEPQLSLAYALSEYADIQIKGSYTYIADVRGDNYIRETGMSDGSLIKYPDLAGASFSALDVQLGIKLKVF